MQFYVLSVAELYQTLNGGQLITADILVDEPVQNLYN